MDMIRSTGNPLIKETAKLLQRKYQEASQSFLLEGQHPIQEAIAAGLSLQHIFCLEGKPMPDGLGETPISIVTESVMKKLSSTASAPPIVAVAQQPQAQLESLLAKQSLRLIGLWGLQDPGNLGTIIRAACAFGADGVLLIGPGVSPWNPKVVRASTGFLFKIPIFQVPSWQDWLEKAPPQLETWGTDVNTGQAIQQVQFGPKTLILMGNEGQGLPPDLGLDKHIHIPMAPGVDSLNVGMAAGIILAQAYANDVKS